MKSLLRLSLVSLALVAPTLSWSQATNAAPVNASEAAAKEEGAVVTESGLVIRMLKEGTGASPKASDRVSVHYRGKLVNGSEFDSSYSRGAPSDFPLGGVIPCWTEGLQRMKVGGKAKLTCPAKLAYGQRGINGVIPPFATLIFEVELVAIKGK
ncbi:FKBP-type peptidyl-prolyl cis-trans isomerase [Rhodoferax aquaticus]|uniref:Peptidyl-prolyl cis-trans isomerase n=1 Tax=Rhodoferax aquaticus TaxID=2527691 RepID=A0A515EL47_9BURK|nr:FKBP-type peptidyl-prolyl cis-trans isomerase [Rhodoferax aquaticus]QDL53385.1 FKBP-type peptidyl-prolyl cis-trans isomerase [Rhodoferax aquaticus]